MKKILLAAGLLFASVTAASAEWGLYVNRDNKTWRIEKTFAFEYETERNCKSAARALWATGAVLGVACVEYSATSYANRGPVRSMPGQPGQRPGSIEQAAEQSGRGRKDAAIEYRQRALESAQESARSNSGGHGRVYSNGDSYYGREVQDAAKALDRERAK